jgi:lipopolysaccharide export system protein LptC
MTADTGFYDSTKEHMDVKDNVRVKSPQYDIWLKSADIDFNTGRYGSQEAVTILTSSGTTMAGDAIFATDSGKELVIEGHVKTIIPPAPAPDEAQAQLKGAAP